MKMEVSRWGIGEWNAFIDDVYRYSNYCKFLFSQFFSLFGLRKFKKSIKSFLPVHKYLKPSQSVAICILCTTKSTNSNHPFYNSQSAFNQFKNFKIIDFHTPISFSSHIVVCFQGQNYQNYTSKQNLLFL